MTQVYQLQVYQVVEEIKGEKKVHVCVTFC